MTIEHTLACFTRILGGIFGACAGGVLGIGVAALIETLSNHAVVLGWGMSAVVGAIAGFLIGIVVPTVAEAIAYVVTMFVP